MTFAGVNHLAIPIAASPSARRSRKASLAIIDGIHWLGVLVIQGAIVGALEVLIGGI